jgi:hypothetical protein
VRFSSEPGTGLRETMRQHKKLRRNEFDTISDAAVSNYLRGERHEINPRAEEAIFRSPRSRPDTGAG